MKVIKIKKTNCNEFVNCLVDDSDYIYLSKRHWQMKDGYAISATWNKATKKSGQIRMHKIILWSPKGYCVDHKDHNRLNNQKNNLRICTNTQNVRNAVKSRANKSGFKGVSWCKKRNKWLAQIKVDGRCYNLGAYEEISDAVIAYRAAASKFHGEFANYG